MKQAVNIAKAMADENRLVALVALRGGELCLCQIIDLLGLAPSTTSKHMNLLYGAGLVERRKEGRWHYFRLPGRGAPPAVKGALKWLLEAAAEPQSAAHHRNVERVRRTNLKELAACYRS